MGCKPCNGGAFILLSDNDGIICNIYVCAGGFSCVFLTLVGGADKPVMDMSISMNPRLNRDSQEINPKLSVLEAERALEEIISHEGLNTLKVGPSCRAIPSR